MRPEYPLKKGKMKFFETSKHHPVTALAVRTVGTERSKALIIDGSATIDPYWMVRVCKRYGFSEREILRRIIVARGFTAYQLKNMVDDLEDILEEEPGISFLGLVNFGGRFTDDDLEREEGIWLRSQSVKRIKTMVRERELYCAVADPEPKAFLKRTGGDIHGKERAYVPSGA